MHAWAHDTQYELNTLGEVQVHDDGLTLSFREGMSLWTPKPADFTPKVGERVRLYGKGIGYPVRGVVMDDQPGVVMDDQPGLDRVIYYRTPDEEEARRQAESARFAQETAEREARAKAAGHDEQAMRAATVPWPKTIEELVAYIKTMTEGDHDYGSCVYAASLATTATFHYVCGVLGMTGFQASMADLDVIRRTRSLEGPFMLIKAEDMLYPQSDPSDKLHEARAKWQPWLKEQALKKLSESRTLHPRVAAHLRLLADLPVAVPGSDQE